MQGQSIRLFRLALLGLCVGGVLALGQEPLPPIAEELPAPRAVKESARPKKETPRAVTDTPVLPPGSVLSGQHHPIDLVTSLQLADSTNPAIGLARARVREAQARQEQAEYLLLPNLSAGFTYLRHDGQIQNAAGLVFTRSRQSLFAGPALGLRVDLADACYQPLVAQRLAEAEVATAGGVRNFVQLEAALAYIDLLGVHAARAINADTLGRVQQMLRRAEAADEAGLNRTKADVPRARTELAVRRQEAIDLDGKAGVASARLARVLLLQPTVQLVPADPGVLPLVLVSAEFCLEDLVHLAMATRPEIRAVQAQMQAAKERVAQARYGPLLPKVQLEYAGGVFGGGPNGDFTNFDSRGDLILSAYWELRNLGLGNLAQIREREAGVDGMAYRLRDIQAQVSAEVVEQARISAARWAALRDAQEAVRQALEMYRRLDETSFGMIGPRAQYDALEPLLAIQSLNNARVQYLASVLEFNRSQFRLYTVMGQPVLDGHPVPQPLELTAVPPPFQPARRSDAKDKKEPGK